MSAPETAYRYEIAAGVCRTCGLKAAHTDERACVKALIAIISVFQSRVWAGNAPTVIAALRNVIAELEDSGKMRRRRR